MTIFINKCSNNLLLLKKIFGACSFIILCFAAKRMSHEIKYQVLTYNKGSTVLAYKKKNPKHFSLSALNKTNKILTWIYNLMIFG